MAGEFENDREEDENSWDFKKAWDDVLERRASHHRRHKVIGSVNALDFDRLAVFIRNRNIVSDPDQEIVGSVW